MSSVAPATTGSKTATKPGDSKSKTDEQVTDANGNVTPTQNSTNAPSTGSPMWPIAAGVGGIVVAAAAFVVSRSKKFKEN